MTSSPSTFAGSLLDRLDRIAANTDSMALGSSNVHYYARSFGDPVSRLFWRETEQGSKLWMGVLPPYGEAFAALLRSRSLDELFADRLLPGLETAEHQAGFDAVYRLDRTPRITYWHEWPPRMLRAATLRLIELLRRLAGQKLTLRNPHPWNLLYDGRTFFYANPGTIVPLDRETFARGYEKVARFFVRPLLLIESGYAHVAQRLAADPRDGVLAEDTRHLQVEWAERKPDSGEDSASSFLSHLAAHVASMACTTGGKHWVDYFERNCDFSPGASWNRKQQALEAMLENTTITSVLDLGANNGYYASVAARLGREVIAADFDPALVDAAFDEASKAALALYPVVLDFSHPTPGQGVGGLWFPPASERFAADLVVCFALVHHMVFSKYRLDFEQAVRGVRSFARKWALVEYVPKLKTRPADVRMEADGWYSVENFAAALGRYFPAVEVLPPANDGRTLLVCGPEGRRL